MQKRSFLNDIDTICEQPFDCEMFSHRNGFLKRSQMHLHDYAEIGICTSGSGLFFIGNEVYSFSKDSVSVIDSGVLHIAQSPDDRPSNWLFVNVRGTLLKLKNGGKILNGLEPAYLMKAITCELEGKHDDRIQNAQNLIEVLFSAANRHEEKNTADYNGKIEKISSALSIIMLKYREEIKINELADACNLNTGYFRKIFKECTGKSPLEYINETRLKEAAMLLSQTDLSVAEISERSGFPTLSHFNRSFLAAYEMSPTKFRKKSVDN